MDYWNYLAHSQGSERAGHRYYARELVGNKGGKNQYRYFYTAEEYSAYKNNKGTPGRGTYAETGKSRDALILPKGTTKARQRAETQESIAKQKREMDIERRNKWKRSVDHEHTRESIKKQKREMDTERRNKWKRSVDRARTQASIASQKAAMDAERRNRNKAKRIGEQHSMDMKRYANEARTNAANARGEKHKQRVNSAIAERVKKEAMAYRSKRRKALKAQMDADRAAKQRRADNTAKRNEWKRSVDRKRTKTSIRAQKVQMDAKLYRRKKRAAAKSRRDFQKRVMDNTRTRRGYQPKMV